MESPVPHLVGTNQAPSNTEMQAVRFAIWNKSRQIYHIDEELDVPQKVINQLIRERNNFRQEMNDHKALLLHPTVRLSLAKEFDFHYSLYEDFSPHVVITSFDYTFTMARMDDIPEQVGPLSCIVRSCF